MANRTFIQSALHKPYDRILFAKEVLSPVFGSAFSLNSTGVSASVQPNKTEQAVISSVTIYGLITLEDGTEITCYEIQLQSSVRIEQSKVAIQRYVRKLLTAGQAALVNFISPANNKTWRLTLVAKDSRLTDDGIKEKTTHAKRYTYLLGPTETCKTAAERFEALSIESEINFQALVNAFSVEKLSKAFFDEYTLHYENFCDYLQDSNYRKSVFKISFPVDATKEDKDRACKPIRDFTKKLLGRIVFLYFVQKKGWLGATNLDYKDGLADFMRQFFESSGGDETFYSNWLTVLFFETLNKERSNDDFKMPNGKKVKVPFLNGGLFDREEHDEHILTFKAKLFHNPDFEDAILTEKNRTNSRGFLDFLNAFNFTVYEDSADEHTVAVDPEMLGHIFENLLEDNKDKGAFYTPKEIVHYMCQQSLVEYLTTHLSKEYTVYREIGHAQVELFGNESKTGQLKMIEQLGDKALSRDDVAYIVNYKDISRLTSDQLKRIDKLLDDVKICDPAIGSGAFPMGLLQEIHAIKEVIAYELKTSWKPAEVKENIIQNSIYGVDIEKGAVDIARLRFWLSLVVDEEKPRALPNLDYKIVVGDSLVSKVKIDGHEEIVEIDWERKKFTAATKNFVDSIQKLLQNIAEKQKKFFKPNTKDKKKLQAEIRNLKLDLLVNQISLNKEVFLSKNLEKGGFAPTASDIKYNTEIKITKKNFENLISRLQILKKNDSDSFEHFDWKLDFPEVLNPSLIEAESRIGFDIIIGNPPYLNFKMYSSEDKERYRHLFPDIFDGKADIYYYFFRKSFSLSKRQGAISFITSRYWIEAEFSKKLRKFIASNSTLKEIIDFKNVTVFDGIGIKTCITSFTNTTNRDTIFNYRYHPGKKISYVNLHEFISIPIPYSNIQKDSWNLTNEEATDIIRKIEEGSTALDEIADCKQGIVTGLDKAFITSSNEFDDLPTEIIKPWLKVGDIHKYVILPVEERKLVYTKLIKNIDDYPILKKRLLSFKEKLTNRREAKNGKIRWFDLQWPREKDFFDSEKLICRFKAEENTFCYDNGKFYCSADTTLVALKPNSKKAYSTKYLLALLNSKVLTFYFKSYGKLMDYRYEYYPGPVGKMRIKFSKYQDVFAAIVDYVLFLKANRFSEIEEQLMPVYFEQVIDGMVYELYFPDLLKAHDRELIKHLGDLPLFTDKINDAQKMEICRNVFKRLNDRDHPIRVNLFYLNSIPEIAVIEGKHENN